MSAVPPPELARIVPVLTRVLTVAPASMRIARLVVSSSLLDPAVIEEVRSAIRRANKLVSRAESVRKFAILPVEFVEANGHLTPKMSIKRHNILKDFSSQIDDIYASNSTAHDVGE